MSFLIVIASGVASIAPPPSLVATVVLDGLSGGCGATFVVAENGSAATYSLSVPLIGSRKC